LLYFIGPDYLARAKRVNSGSPCIYFLCAHSLVPVPDNSSAACNHSQGHFLISPKKGSAQQLDSAADGQTYLSIDLIYLTPTALVHFQQQQELENSSRKTRDYKYFVLAIGLQN
jgi:hypothetical protein